MRSLLKPNTAEGENTCKCCIYFENGFCRLKNKETGGDKKCRKFELDISVKSVKKKRKPAFGVGISDI